MLKANTRIGRTEEIMQLAFFFSFGFKFSIMTWKMMMKKILIIYQRNQKSINFICEDLGNVSSMVPRRDARTRRAVTAPMNLSFRFLTGMKSVRYAKIQRINV